MAVGAAPVGEGACGFLFSLIVDATALPGLMFGCVSGKSCLGQSAKTRWSDLAAARRRDSWRVRSCSRVRLRLEVGKTARLLWSEAVNPTMHANGGLPLHELPKVVVLAVAR